MKARIKATGQIIDVYLHKAAVLKAETNLYREKGVPTSCNLFYKESMLDFTDTIDWEERRFQIAKAVLCSIKSNPILEDAYGDLDDQIESAIQYADELIKQLKEDK